MELNYIKNLIEQRYAISIMGPTATAKSQLSLYLSEYLPIEIISVDSSLIYQDMNVGTAKPSPQELTKVPHHLIDIIQPTQSYSVAEFITATKKNVTSILARNHLPVLVGGTMMYFNALQKGISELPPADIKIRQYWLKKWQDAPSSLHDYLQEIDAESAARIHHNDKQRLIRAIEVFLVSNKTLSEFRRQTMQPLTEFKLIKFATLPDDREILHKRIAIRFQQMLDAGFIDEVKNLQQKYPCLHSELPSMRSVGYRQCFSYLSKKIDLATFKEKSIIATRQLAKRQITWLRKEDNVVLLNTLDNDLKYNTNKILTTIKAHRLA